MKTFLIFFDDEKENSLIHELSITNISVERKEEKSFDIKDLKNYKAENDTIYTIKIPPLKKNGKPTMICSFITRMREILDYSPFGIHYGKFTETKREYLKREKKELMKIIKR